MIHTVLSAETLSDIAAQYGVEISAVVAANGITDSNSLSIGQEVLVPNPERFEAPAPPATPTATAAPRSAGGGGGATTARTGPQSRSGFIWPVTGPLSSYFGPSHPLGIDIDLYATPNAPIGAAAAGTVTFAGGNTCCSYGLYVIIDHGNGFQTLYAHMSSLSVSAGQRVSQGTVIGYGGRTGYATGNHLHLEVRLNGSVVNPLSYLP